MIAALSLVLFVAIGGVWGQTCVDTSSLADSSDSTCKRFFYCSQGNFYQLSCPDDLIFYPGLNQCVIPSSYQCVCNPPGCARPSCAGRENTDMPDTTDCGKFYNCKDQYPLRRSCQPGLIFSEVDRTCVSSGSGYVCPYGPFVCPATDGTYADLRDPACQTYYTCRGGQPGAKQVCPNDWCYYQNMQRCVIRDSYDCHKKNPFQCPAPDQDFADPEDRSRYYYCNGWNPLRRRCNQGQVYDSTNSRCQ